MLLFEPSLAQKDGRALLQSGVKPMWHSKLGLEVLVGFIENNCAMCCHLELVKAVPMEPLSPGMALLGECEMLRGSEWHRLF